MKPIIITHHHEIGLKGRNRGYFEKHLLRNVRLGLKGVLSPQSVTGGYGRFVIKLGENQENSEEIIKRLRKIFGLANICVGYEVVPTLESFKETAYTLLSDRKFKSICVRAKRADKNFPIPSQEINAEVGGFLCDKFQIRANLTAPDQTIFIEIANKSAYVYQAKIPGANGLPAGISGRVVSLISAGFDSPVSSFKLIKRGSYVIFVHFHSYPYVSHNSIDQVKKIVKKLTQYQFHSKLYLVPFAECQQDIVINAPMALRVILYRRMMVRTAEKIAHLENANALITGESLGQVASQTLRNIRVINDATELPVLRPLIGSDKEEIMNVARDIDTYDISKEPYDDCCSFLTPRNPETWADPEKVLEAETKYDVYSWVKKLVLKSEKFDFSYPIEQFMNGGNDEGEGISTE